MLSILDLSRLKEWHDIPPRPLTLSPVPEDNGESNNSSMCLNDGIEEK